MEAKTTEWRPGPTVCRCCLTEGCYKDISTEYFWMGKREVYSEMLSETLDLNIAYSQSGGPNSNSRLICEPCISRLRDATDFKRQVLECERSFMQYLDPVGSVDIGVTLELDKDVKIERVKDEKTLLDDDDDEFVPPEFGDEDDDDLDDQPLTKLASKIPKKESVDVLDLLDNAKITEKRKSSSKSKSSPAKKSKLKKEVASSSKVKPEPRKKKEVEYVIIARNNAKVVLKHSTVYPFRIPTVSMVCVFCCESYDDPREYRNHIDEEHSSFSVETAFAHSVNNYTEFLKVDCVDLSCRICFHPFSTIESIAKHLFDDHRKNIDPNVEVGMQMFKLGPELWVCALCDVKLPTLRELSRHTSSHYHKYTCEICGKSYINKENLYKHIEYVHTDNKVCKCKRMFNTAEERRAHFVSSEKCWPYSCNVCLIRFMTHKAKNDHLVEYHGHIMKSYTCSECEKVFDKWHSYKTHFIMSHTENSFACSFCTNKFPTKTALAVHIVTHTKSQDFPCSLCPKKFSRRKNLMQHILIHNEKRFECTSCNKKFSQKVSLKLHMKNHHRDIYDIKVIGQ